MELDSIDKKIIYELDKNARTPLKQIAKAIRSNRSVVAYRLKKLETSGIIRGYFTEINNTALGLTGFRVFFKYKNYDKSFEEELIAELLKDQRIAWCFTVKGRWDLDVIYWCKDRFEFYDAIKAIKLKFNHFIDRMEVSTIVDILHFPKSYLICKKRDGVGAKKLGRSKYVINEAERKLLHAIAFDARKDILEISRELGMSINTVKKYLKRLLKNEVILGFRPFVDINRIGYNYFKVHLDLHNYGDKDLKSIITFLEYDSNIVYLDFYIGGADIEIEYHTEDEGHVYEKLDDLRSRFGRFIRSYFIIKFDKEYVVRYMPGGG